MKYRRCKLGLWDTSIPDVNFDKNGVSNYCKMYKKLDLAYPKGLKGEQTWSSILEKVKAASSSSKYDCIIGLSGGTDSSYLLHLAKGQWGLNPLAVNLDNGWSSEIAVSNIRRLTTSLNVDLYTHVIDYDDVKTVLKSYLKASLPWVDGPTDMAIRATLYRVADREGVKTIFSGSDFSSEGRQPRLWSKSDYRQFKYILNNFADRKVNEYPILSLSEYIFFNVFRRIKLYRPFYYIDYSKQLAQEYLSNEYGWKYYGGHHYENIFTKFIIGHWLYSKFNIDKRIITLSAQVINGSITRNNALDILNEKPYSDEDLQRDKKLVLKKLDLTDSDFKSIWNMPRKTFLDYPSYDYIQDNVKKILKHTHSFLLPEKPNFLILED
ncbi:MAG: N-acetyl sugar amidotransferase [Candidatus Poseidoniales archaeon]